MRKVIYSMMVSLDSFVEDVRGSLDWVIVDEELHKFINAQESSVDTYLHGRKMYELMAEYWPTADEDPSNPDYIIEYARIWKNMNKIVFSKTLDKVGWNSRLVRGSIPEEIARLKAQPGKDIEVGGADLASTFMQLDLIDEFRLYFNPVVLGSGTPMFQGLTERINLQLVEVRKFNSGVVLLHYERVDTDNNEN